MSFPSLRSLLSFCPCLPPPLLSLYRKRPLSGLFHSYISLICSQKIKLDTGNLFEFDNLSSGSKENGKIKLDTDFCLWQNCRKIKLDTVQGFIPQVVELPPIVVIPSYHPW
jgi:hypothetical protein